MSDDADKASDSATYYERAALSRRRSDGPTATGFCHFCGEPVAFSMRWCDEHCRDDWEKEQHALHPKPER